MSSLMDIIGQGAHMISHTTNAIRQTPPITIMAIIWPAFHVFAVLAASVIGTSSRESPAANRIRPMRSSFLMFAR